MIMNVMYVKIKFHLIVELFVVLNVIMINVYNVRKFIIKTVL